MTRPATRRALRLSGLLAWVALLLAAPAAPDARADPGVPEPADYRMSGYRAPTPETLAGATVVTTRQAAALVESGAVLPVDVLPRPPKPSGLREGTIWRQPPRANIPGSVWLPNTGFGALNEESERYLRDSLRRLTAGDSARGLLFYCLDDCWMSWNAARRALEYGYESVYWYPEGTDGWAAAGRPLEACEPLPGGEGG